MTPLLELNDVSARYGPIVALHGVSLTVGEGEIVALLGANGAGKTTTLRAVSGTVRRTGDIVIGGRRLARQGPEAVARAFLQRPRLLMLDEPSLGLAPLVTREVFRVVADLNQKEGLAVIVVEQNAVIALAAANRAYV